MKIGTPSLIARNVVYLSGPGPTELLVVRSQFSFEVCKERKLEIKTHVVVICIFPEGVSSTYVQWQKLK